MKLMCPKCNSTNIASQKCTDGNSVCIECNHTDKTTLFPVGTYQLPLPPLQEEIDKWCDEMKVSKEGYFYKNASKMCEEVINSQIKPWEDENKKLKLLIKVMEDKYESDFVTQALGLIKDGEDTIEDENGILILSYQYTETEVDEGESNECE